MLYLALGNVLHMHPPIDLTQQVLDYILQQIVD